MPARDVPMDGTLVYHCDPRSPALEWLQRRKLPLVFVDQEPTADVPSINVDDRGGARAAAEHLIALGHRRIGIVNAGVVGPHGLQLGGDPGPAVVRDHSADARLAGRAGRRRHDPVVIKQSHSTEEEGYAALGLLLDSGSGHHRRAVLRRHVRARHDAGRPGPRPRTAAATCRWSASTTTRWQSGSVRR